MPDRTAFILRGMIYDQLEQFPAYRSVSKHFGTAAEWLAATDLSALRPSVERIEIAGDRVFAKVEAYVTRGPRDWVLEAHERYWDLQVVLGGKEMVRVLRQDGSGDEDCELGGPLRVDEPYDESRDVVFYDPTEFQLSAGAGFDMVLGTGVFLALGPRDIHGPCRTVTGEKASAVRKLVVKVAVA